MTEVRILSGYIEKNVIALIDKQHSVFELQHTIQKHNTSAECELIVNSRMSHLPLIITSALSLILIFYEIVTADMFGQKYVILHILDKELKDCFHIKLMILD